MNPFNNIPLELTTLKQWVVWRLEKSETGRDTKMPYHPHTMQHASSTDPATWVTFEQVCNAMGTGHWTGIGFMLSPDDPYTFIDLDDPYALGPDGKPKHIDPAKVAAMQGEVYQRFNGTYAELSPSGKGLHIICRGMSPSGRRRSAVEMYSRDRFMTMTGNVFANYPIADRQAPIQWLYDEMGGAPTVQAFTGEYVDAEPDEVVIAKCLNAANGPKVQDLATGNWQAHYSSQSEADFALINIIAYYTKSRFQIMRIFRQSALGQREKAARDGYILPMIDRAFDRMPAALDMAGIYNALEAEFGPANFGHAGKSPATAEPLAQAEGTGVSGLTPAQTSGGSGGVVTTPNPETAIPRSNGESNPYLQQVPGLLGQIAYYIYDQAPRPVPEIALAGAIGLMAGICGRAWNISGTGLNQYTLLLAGTGRGKEALASGITKLMSRVRDIDGGGCPAAAEFTGPGDIASGQGLVKHLEKNSTSFVSIVGEVDTMLDRVSSRHASSAEKKLRSTLLDLYNKSGRGEQLGSTAYSDQDKNIKAISSPAFSMIGEGTPERFYNLLGEEMINDGLLPRFTIIEYNGERGALREVRNNEPPVALVKAVGKLCGHALQFNQQNRPLNVVMDDDASQIMRLFDREIDGRINNSKAEIIAQIWNRAHIKALKLAALVAVGIDPLKPVIDANCAAYAISLIEHSTKRIESKFAAGAVGSGDARQMADMVRKIKDYVSGKVSQGTASGSHGIPFAAYDAKLVNYTYLSRACVNLASFKSDKLGATKAVKNTVQTLLETGVIAEVGSLQERQRLGIDKTNVRFYAVIAQALVTAGSSD